MVKWCAWFRDRGHEIHVVSFTPGEIAGVRVHTVDIGVDTGGSDFGKLRYLTAGGRIRQIVKGIAPDVVNVHYATSYGAAVALSGLKGYVLSVWGSDIYDFPNKSPLHKALLKYSLRKAAHLFSTSQAMADEAARYTDRKFVITPFGVDMALFSPDKRTRKAETPFTIGTVKTLSDLYGIDYILKAAAKLKRENPELGVSVRIAGDGPKLEEYRQLARDLGIEAETVFLGRITQAVAAVEWANMDVAVFPSVLYESFGVAAVEAQSCGTPVIVSDVGGLMEATKPGVSSCVVPRRDEGAIAEAIMKLYRDPALRKRMGEQGREYVAEKYEINHCFEAIEDVLKKYSGGHS